MKHPCLYAYSETKLFVYFQNEYMMKMYHQKNNKGNANRMHIEHEADGQDRQNALCAILINVR